MLICKHEHEKNMTRFGARSCLKLMLNNLKKMRGPTLIYTLWKPSSRKFAKRILCVHQVIRKFLENFPN